ncbi:glycosyltransferase family 2 protein [Chishuiella sp.]|uniref:glycosyltransferase family 2 protein n=1 Tax=Chishuiella sp. TaxID=1969467 RepID=UPI0028A78399|nr:glycosyltransferase [Chishuiella sp.]
MNIIIKSFNRAFYLDRCLKSIENNVKGNYDIIILDDGTPSKFIEKLKIKYPNVCFNLSSQVKEKQLAIESNLKNGTKIDGFKIPTDLWKITVEKSDDYVLVIEDDVWFTKEINLNNIINQMILYKIPLVKLGWLGNLNDEINFCEVKDLSVDLKSVIPKKIFTSNKFIMNLFMYNKYKFFTILYKLGIVDNYTKNKYWTLNSILMGLYHKDYWLSIWKDAKGLVDEKQQLRNAAVWYHNNKKVIFARTKEEVLKTTFQSSATGSYHKGQEEFDVNRMNHILNEAWYNDEFDSIENYPKDFSNDYIKKFLDKENHPDAQYQEWFNWAEKFRQQYRTLGAEID